MSIDVVNLQKRFGSTQALDGMNFTVHSGKLFGFVGSNGAGKTTTMRIILGVLEADSGEVLRDGTPLTFADRQHFGYMPEERGLYPKMKVGEQLIYLARLHGLSKEDATAKMEFWTERLGVAGRRDDPVQTLSLGNQQRVQLAAALIHEPRVMILDEPFSGLDPLAVDDMSTVLKEQVAQGAIVLFSSHQLDLVERLCDEVGICSRGKIVAKGTIDELRTTADIYYDVTTGEDSRLLAGYLSGTALRADDATAGAEPLPHLETQILSPHSLRVKLSAGVSDQDVLRAALSVGTVHGFERFRPHLNELFANVVSTAPLPQPDVTKKPKRRFLKGKHATTPSLSTSQEA
ncbi:MAG: ATP-binding cassette domain-containing protein [Actinomycetaceae bacterium]|nr:ATP-binding cassette domain-containing protein [Actinomycetaceae bacterium]MDY5854340.1 ATP-binding cassette domain-containing protein [Arcanobacterium sp.]